MSQARAIVRQKQSSTQIKTEMNLPCTGRTVRNVLQKNSIDRYAKLRSHSPLTFQKTLRLEFAKKHVSFGCRWKNVRFFDEK